MTKGKDTLGMVLTVASAGMMLVALVMVFLYAPREVTMGNVQRIFYFHVAAAWVGFFAFFVVLVASIGYLVRGGRRWDILALSSVEIGVTFMSMVLITGSLWARPVWNTWWTWEPRLTISAVQWLIYVAYGMLRAAIEEPGRRARFAAVYGIVSFVTVPLSWFAIRWWRTIHPEILTGGGGPGQTEMAITPRMMHTLLVSLVAFTLLYITLLRQRARLERVSDVVEELRLRLQSR